MQNRLVFHFFLVFFIAALDAYCLLEVYDVLVKKIKQLGLAINIESTLSYKTKPRKTKMERKQQKVAEKPDRTGNRVQVRRWMDGWMDEWTHANTNSPPPDTHALAYTSACGQTG